MKISVLTPSFNAAEFIERAVVSVLQQDYDNWEHIIIDGESTDGTIDILKKYSHITWVSEPDKGQSDAMNKAFSLATGDVIVYLNTDDYFERNVFSQIIAHFLADPSSKFVYGKIKKIFNDRIVDFIASGDLYEILNYWPCRFPGNPVGYFYKKEVQINIGKFPMDNQFTMDYWFLLSVYHLYRIDYLPLNFGFYQCFGGKSEDIERAKTSLKTVRDAFLREHRLIEAAYKFKSYKSLTTKKLVKLARKIKIKTQNLINIHVV